MAEFFDHLTDEHIAFVQKQPIFFVSTATDQGRINLSPKGLDAFRVLGPKRVAYLDLGGSGNETRAHLAADGRITLMLCAFENPPLIYRIYGRGRPVLPEHADWGELAQHFELLSGTRQIFDIAVESTQTSCGWGVPLMSLQGDRGTLPKAHEILKANPEVWVEKYQERTKSIDGLPIEPTTRYFGPPGDLSREKE